MKFFNLILIPIIIFSFYVVRLILALLDKDIREAKGDDLREKQKRINKYIKKAKGKIEGNETVFKYLERVKVYLKRHGSTMNVYKYYLLKLLLCVIGIGINVVVNILIVKQFILIWVPIVFYFLIDIDLKYNNYKNNKEIIRDLPKIYELLDIETYGGIPFEDTLMRIYDVAKCKRLQMNLKLLSADIILNSDVLGAIKRFNKNFKSDDINIFCMTIKQEIDTGSSREMFMIQAKSLYKRFLHDKNFESFEGQTKVMISMLMLLLSFGTMILYAFYDVIITKLHAILNF